MSESVEQEFDQFYERIVFAARRQDQSEIKLDEIKETVYGVNTTLNEVHTALKDVKTSLNQSFGEVQRDVLKDVKTSLDRSVAEIKRDVLKDVHADLLEEIKRKVKVEILDDLKGGILKDVKQEIEELKKDFSKHMNDLKVANEKAVETQAEKQAVQLGGFAKHIGKAFDGYTNNTYVPVSEPVPLPYDIHARQADCSLRFTCPRRNQHRLNVARNAPSQSTQVPKRGIAEVPDAEAGPHVGKRRRTGAAEEVEGKDVFAPRVTDLGDGGCPQSEGTYIIPQRR